MLSVENLRVVYHDVISVLNGVSLKAAGGQISVIIGANGAGKTTLLRAIGGMLDIYEGDIIEGDIKIGEASVRGLDSTDIIRKFSLTYVMEDRPVFWYLTIEENLAAAAYSRWDGAVKADMEKVFEYFPVLRKLRDQKAGYTSGGEQQMLAIGMSLMTRPKILLFDEPSLGLAPLVSEELFRIIQRLNQEGMTVLLVEQNAHAALQIGHHGYVLENGRVVLEGTAGALLENEDVREFYLGAGAKERKSYQDAKRYKRRKRWL
ncbi:MAG: branched-chain amino acid ABC transporter ATP-binding protein [Deltaproteobacteria bacterium SM23_61]|nr:MAG: branched-chain amino acid ABC transporter ATP-binding protein [Deltaproteobacteria bacterium SM23_61]